MMEKELLEQLKNDAAFVEEIRNADNSEEIAKLFEVKGINVDASQIAAICNEGGNDELNENDLENVTGGVVGILAGVAAILFLAGLAKGTRCNG